MSQGRHPCCTSAPAPSGGWRSLGIASLPDAVQGIELPAKERDCHLHSFRSAKTYNWSVARGGMLHTAQPVGIEPCPTH